MRKIRRASAAFSTCQEMPKLPPPRMLKLPDVCVRAASSVMVQQSRSSGRRISSALASEENDMPVPPSGPAAQFCPIHLACSS